MEHHEWGWMVVVYLYVGGLGAGALVLSGLAHLSRRPHLRGIARAGALVAPLLVAGGSGLLVFDLGRPLAAWRLFVAFEPVSPMWIGSWLLTLFIFVGLIAAALHLPSDLAELLATKVPLGRGLLRLLAAFNRDGGPRPVRLLRDGAAAVGIPLGVGVGIYTGVLLGAIPARPFWNTPMVAQLFLFSALSTASAMLLLLAPLFGKNNEEHRTLVAADLVFIVIELFIIVPFIVHAQLGTLSVRAASTLVIGGPYTMPFWIGVVLLGVLVPMLFEVSDLLGWIAALPRPLRRAVHFTVPVLILVGGYLLRWVFVHAGQASSFG